MNGMRREILTWEDLKENTTICKDDHLVIKGPPPIFDNINIAFADKWWMCGLEYGLLTTLP